MKRWHILASLLLIAGTVGLAATPAQAATVTGLCMTNYANTCARVNGHMVDAWPRDISGDYNQQFTKGYIGQVSATRCWPFACGSGFNNIYNGESVWDFWQTNNMCINVSGTQNQANMAGCNPYGNSAQLFVWTPTGALINVYQTDYWGAPQALQGNGSGQCKVYFYQPLVTWDNPATACTSTWTMVNGT